MRIKEMIMELLIVKQILLVSTLGNVWRICRMMLGCKGLKRWKTENTVDSMLENRVKVKRLAIILAILFVTIVRLQNDSLRTERVVWFAYYMVSFLLKISFVLSIKTDLPALDGNLCFRALFKKIGSVGTPSRFSFLFSKTLCFYSTLETISFCRKSGRGGCETTREPNSLCNSPLVEVIQDVGCNHLAVHTHSWNVNAYYFFVTSLATILDILSRDRLWEKRIPSEGEFKDVPRPLPSWLLHPHFWKLSRLRTWGCYFWWVRSTG